MRRLPVLASSAFFAALAIGMGTKTFAQTESGAVEEPAGATETVEPAASADASTVERRPSTKPEKRLHTIPEDGDPDPAKGSIPGWLRALLDSRGNEDVIVCVAGCSPHRDRVVHAMTKDVRPAAAAAAGSDGASSARADGSAPNSVDNQTAFEPTAAMPADKNATPKASP